MKPAPIAALTGARGLPALAIVVFHYFELYGYPALGMWSGVARSSYLWVDFFFMLSGFVLARSAAARFEKGIAWSEAASFIARRLARLYPVHLLMLLLLLAIEIALRLHWAGEQGVSFFAVQGTPGRTPESFVSNVFLVQAWWLHDSLTWNKPAWFVSAEFALVLLFPLLAFAIGGRFGVRGVLALVAGLAGIVAVFSLADQGLMGLSFHDGVYRGLVDFIAGMGLSLVALGLGGRLPATMTDGIAFGVIQVLALWLLFETMTFGPERSAVVLAMALFLASLIADRGIVARFFALAPLMFLGRVSYGVYMGHWLFITTLPLLRAAVGFTPDWTLEALWILAASLAFGILLTLAVEDPAREPAERLFGRLLGARPPAA